MTEVLLHVYDVTNRSSVKVNTAIVQMNRFLRGGIGLGGIFHSAIQVYGEKEWSFGYCESGTGVFSCHPKKNPMYTYRETISLGHTDLLRPAVKQILNELTNEWPGISYNLLSRNCNHFCNALCERLGIQNLPAWVNRCANVGDAAANMVKRTSQIKTEIVATVKAAYRSVFGGAARSRNGGCLPKLSNLKNCVDSMPRNCLGYSGDVVEKVHVF